MDKTTAMKVLYLEDSVPDFEIICMVLTDAGNILDISRVDKQTEFASSLCNNRYDIILADYNLPGFDAFGALRLRNQLCPDVPFICVSGSIGEELAIELLKLGASDYVIKDRPGRLPFAVKRALEEANEKRVIRQAEDEIKKSKKSWEGIFHGLSHPTVILDVNHNILEINENLRKKLGKDLTEIKKLKCWEIFHKPGTVCPPEGCPFEKMLFSNSIKTTEMEIEAFGGFYLVNCTPIFDDEGKLEKIIHIATDITERKLAEEELIKAKDHAEESDRLKTAFLANISHEIRTPMNGILGFSELLKEPGLTGEQQNEYINIIEKSGARMLNIINDIVDISKIEAGLATLHVSETNINGKIEFLCRIFKPEIEGKGIQLTYQNGLSNEDAVICVDSDKLVAILNNLLKNAAKFTDSGSIEFGYTLVETLHATSLHATSLHATSPHLRFFVKDTGIGIPRDRQNAVFERFIQADISDSKAYQGAGLGLTISKAYVELLGGEIWLESEENTGTTIYFSLPYHPPSSENDTNPCEFIVIADKENPNVADLKILIVEDDLTSEMFLRNSLKALSSNIHSATTGSKAIEACRETDFELVLMDINLPDTNGYEITRQIRQFNQKVVIIAQTAYGLFGDREKAITAGCNDYISKPICRKMLIELIHKHFFEGQLN